RSKRDWSSDVCSSDLLVRSALHGVEPLLIEVVGEFDSALLRECIDAVEQEGRIHAGELGDGVVEIRGNGSRRGGGDVELRRPVLVPLPDRDGDVSSALV